MLRYTARIVGTHTVRLQSKIFLPSMGPKGRRLKSAKVWLMKSAKLTPENHSELFPTPLAKK